MNKSVISVIVPVYNTEKYLNKCIESIVSQTYGNLEIILVDDHSTDNSGDICDAWEKKDNRIKVFHNPENLGVSASRNFALDHISGDYVSFVDSDDFIHERFYDRLLDAITSNNADVVLCHEQAFFEGQDDENFVALKVITDQDIIVEDHNLYIKHFMDSFTGPIGWSCNKLFKASILTGCRYIHKTYEDIVFNAEVSKSIKKAVWIPDRIYAYRLREDSFTAAGKSDLTYGAAESFFYTYKIFEHNDSEFANEYIVYTLGKIANLSAQAKRNFGNESYLKLKPKYDEKYDLFKNKFSYASKKDRLKLYLARHFFPIYYLHHFGN